LEGPNNEQIKFAVVELHARSEHKYFQEGGSDGRPSPRL